MDTQKEIKDGADFLDTLNFVARFELIGSATITPTVANDVDYAVLLRDGVDLEEAKQVFIEDYDFSPCGEYDFSNDTSWFSVRRGFLNLIVTTDAAWHSRYVAAMEVCKLLDISEKAVRIAVCQIVREGRKAHEFSEVTP